MTAPASLLRCVLAAALLGPPAAAADLSNLDINLPNTLDDAFAIERGGFELQGAMLYDRRHGRDTVRLLPRLLLGVAEGLQASVFLPYVAGNGRELNRADAGASLLYNLNREAAWLPALAVVGEVSAPVGPGDRGAETGLTFIATKTIDPAAVRRLHLNAAWLRNLGPNEEERRDGYRAVVGYSQLVASNVVVVLDYLRYSQERRERAANVFEAGLRWQVAEHVVLGAGFGFGVGRDSPRFRALFSVQIALGGP